MPFIEDVAHVEVVPGAFSSLYGSNAIGGVANIITKQPDKREFTAKVKKGWSDASGEDVGVYFRDRMDTRSPRCRGAMRRQNWIFIFRNCRT